MTNQEIFHNINSILDELRNKDPLKFKELFDGYEIVKSYNDLLSLRIHRDSALPHFTVMFDYNTILQSRVRIHITDYHAISISSDYATMFTKYKMYVDGDLSIKSVNRDKNMVLEELKNTDMITTSLKLLTF